MWGGDALFKQLPMAVIFNHHTSGRKNFSMGISFFYCNIAKLQFLEAGGCQHSKEAHTN